MELGKNLTFISKDSDFLFRSLSEEDVTEFYVSALREQRAFLAANPEGIDMRWQQKYIQDIRLSKFNTICGLFSNSILLGTAGIQNIKKNETATIGIFILDPELRGKGYGKILIWSGCYLINHLFGIDSIAAGVKKTNIASWKAFLSCGFQIEREVGNELRLHLKIEKLVKIESIQKVAVQSYWRAGEKEK